MKFSEYQAAAGLTAIYPHAGEGDIVALAYLGLGLGEAGEVQGKIKKILRDNDGRISDDSRVKISAELGDLLWYIARTCSELGVSLDDVAGRNIDKLQGRALRGVLGGSGDDR
jgi:NTP pyrophosphatase (non-canonical NTP hydrolase)